MYIVLGGTGHVGSATARALIDLGEQVTVVTRSRESGKPMGSTGARIATADVRDSEGLREVFKTGRRAFLLNPPADPTGDTDSEERANMSAILEALEGSGLEKVVLASTYGAFPGERCGDLTVLYEFENRLRDQQIPAAINRAGYYMTNWTGMVDMLRETRTLPSLFPPDFSMPMVAPRDLGEAAARRLASSTDDVGVTYVEGPRQYTPQEVAQALSEALGFEIEVETIPREAWVETFRQFGFSDAAAQSYACMTAAVMDGKTRAQGEPERGHVTLAEYLRATIG